MRIYFERSGGLMGRRAAVTVDTDTLPPAEAQAWQELVSTARFFELPERLAASTRGADQFHYKVRVEIEDRHHSFEADESALPPDLEPLLQRLRPLARHRPAF